MGRVMASVLIRALDETVKRRLIAQAKANGRSMEAEARELLTRGVSKPNIGLAIMRAAQDAGGVEDLAISPRDSQTDTARVADFE